MWSRPATPSAPAPAGLRLIIGYKLAKAGIELLAAAAFFFFGSAVSAAKLAHAAQFIRHHVTETWSIALAEQLIDASTASHVRVVALAVLADSVVTLIEGWALQRRYVWSRWLVIGTTSSLLPFEVLALLKHPNAGRALLLLLNLLIVAYLLRRHAEPGQPGPA